MIISEFVKSCVTENFFTNEERFTVGDTITCKQIGPLTGNAVGPPLEMDKDYILLNIYLDSEGNAHFNIGLTSEYNYVRSYITEEHLPNSGKGDVHWCDPVRFIVKK